MKRKRLRASSTQPHGSDSRRELNRVIPRRFLKQAGWGEPSYAGQPVEQHPDPIPFPAGGKIPSRQLLHLSAPARPAFGRLPQQTRPARAHRSTRCRPVAIFRRTRMPLRRPPRRPQPRSTDRQHRRRQHLPRIPRPPVRPRPQSRSHPASLLEQAAYLHRIGDYNREQQPVGNRAGRYSKRRPPNPRETPPASLCAGTQRPPLSAGPVLSGRRRTQPRRSTRSSGSSAWATCCRQTVAGPQPDRRRCRRPAHDRRHLPARRSAGRPGPFRRSRSRLPRIPGKAPPAYRRRRGVCRRCLARRR